jgi:hypothetical protein
MYEFMPHRDWRGGTIVVFVPAIASMISAISGWFWFDSGIVAVWSSVTAMARFAPLYLL